MAEKNGVVQGILPLFWHKNRFSETSFVLCHSSVKLELRRRQRKLETRSLSEATVIARELKVDYLEMRHRDDPLPGMHSKKNKVMLVCDVHADSEQNMQQLVTKMRTNVRRTLKSGLAAEFGGKELLADFYRMFSAQDARTRHAGLQSHNSSKQSARTFPQRLLSAASYTAERRLVGPSLPDIEICWK